MNITIAVLVLMAALLTWPAPEQTARRLASATRSSRPPASRWRAAPGTFPLRQLIGVAGVRRGNRRIGPRQGRPGSSSNSLMGLLGRARSQSKDLDLAVVVQQLASLLRGGRHPSRLWEELWLVHGGEGGRSRRTEDESKQGFVLSEGSREVLSSARGAAALGLPAADAIRAAARRSFPAWGSPNDNDGKERRIWSEIAACIDVAERSGCPLADILVRYAAQLEAERDSNAARQTALAGPRATVTLLSWLPLLGLGLGTVLGVDPVGVLLGSPFGIAALIAGLLLAGAGRLWSSRLVRIAAA